MGDKEELIMKKS